MTPQEGWGFTAQQAAEKLLKIQIVMRDDRPPFTRLLNVLAQLAAVELDPRLAALQPYAVEARCEEGPFPLSARREAIPEALEQLRDEAVASLGEG
jgi:hypothetical protein